VGANVKGVVFRFGSRGFVRAGILDTEQNEDHRGPEINAGWDVAAVAVKAPGIDLGIMIP
jgi:hypothetical protein